ncbi:hypothetical protein HPP92_012509 [Vanilla planifolia]|uniref:Uncharacterized protein n=1 Tax=Vanilla planifolia TaxID=51239 RepID=A0A835R2Q9_VANPL|nr:hypothetical protein HPP92_012509 [Vanilla planifolia]
MLQPQTLDGSALGAKANHREKGRSYAPVQYQSRKGQWKENKDNLWDKCWKLNEKPPSHEWGTRGGQSRPQTYMTDPLRPQAHMVEQTKNEEKNSKVAIGEFSGEDIERRKAVPDSTQVQESNSDPGIETMTIYVAVMTTLLNFVRLFRRAHEENCKQEEIDRKKAQKEAETDKSKDANATKKRDT